MMAAATRKCLSCREVRGAAEFASVRARRCERCRKAGGPPRACSHCGEARAADQFVYRGKVCAACREEERLPPRACVRCHEVKPADAFPVGGQTRQSKARRQGEPSTRRSAVCEGCWREERRERAAAAEERRATWEEGGRLVRRCWSCREVRPFPEEFYAARASGERDHRCKQCAREQAQRWVEEVRTDPARLAEFRERRAEQMRQWRARNPDRVYALNVAYHARLAQDPERYAARLEANRMDYRLRRERAGYHVPPVKESSPSLREPSLPAAPLATALVSYLRRNAPLNPETGEPLANPVLEGMGIEPRTFYAWRVGERASVRFAVVDRALTAMGLNWWDVWDPAEHPEVARQLEC